MTRLDIAHLWVDREMEKVGRGGEEEAEEQQVGEGGEAGGPEVGCVDQQDLGNSRNIILSTKMFFFVTD